ncbi:MAG: PEGA domain-containing protein [Gemmatimonadetes bacterium]|nr:PEGA domain-containing protein [Gemmatimonadota bacterium]MYB60466.1 PEGA domain-containing protein [Gemmatimonadota bacterium]
MKLRQWIPLMMVVFPIGCATIMHGKTQSVGVSSVPEGATVSVNNQHLGITPLFIELKRKDQHIVNISLDGYHTARLTLQRKASGWVWGNIIFGGIIGLAVDAITGGLYKLEPAQLSTTLVSQSSTVHRSDEGIYIVTVLDPNSDWVKIGQLESR